MQRCVCSSSVAIVLSASFATAGVLPVQMQMRLVRQTGTLPGPITDVDANSLYNATPGEAIRFEVQYRVLDLDPNDSIVPAGLSACLFNLSSTSPGYRFQRAQLSRFEAQLAAADPPASVDVSGLPSGLAVNRAGLHVPTRFYNNINNNFYGQNGVFVNGNGVNVADIDPVTAGDQSGNTSTEGDGIINILPLTITQSNQGNVNTGQDNNSWYGLYSFMVIAGSVNSNINLNVPQSRPTSVTYTYFNDGVAQPVEVITPPADANYRIIVPAPGSAAALILAAGVGIGRRRRGGR